MMFQLMWTACLGVALSWLVFVHYIQTSCRCQPWESCWPSREEWNSLNRSMNFNLFRLVPTGSVCYQPSLDPHLCEEVMRMSRDSGWRASQPGALQDWIWESGQSADDACPLGSQMKTHTQCHQGRIPLYSAMVSSAKHVQDAVMFAKRHNLRLIVRNTGHDLAGRSSSPNALQIHTNRLQGVHFHENFQLHRSERSVGPAVSVEAGVMMGDLYAKSAQNGYIVVGGDCPTVGVAGGFLQGGGVSDFLSLHHGLAVDNALEFEVVTASGDIVLANAIHNSDLFWALRGGGGGTFGIVTRVTMRVFPDVPAVVAELSVQTSHSHGNYARSLAVFFNILQTLNRESVGGQLIMTVISEHSIEPFVEDISRIESHVTYESASLSKLSMNYRKVPDIHTDNDYGVLGSSVAISNSLFNASNGPTHVAEALARLPTRPGDLLFTSNLGGQVMKNGELMETSMHPAWRHAAQLINFVRTVEPTNEGKMEALQNLTNIHMPLLYAVDPGFRLSYRNVGDPNEKNFQQVYWGQSYIRLLQLKRRWDPKGLFISKLGVGSEEWDSEGMCRTR